MPPKPFIVLLLLSLLVGCGSEDKTVPSFNGSAAFSYLEKQVSFGPRVPGSEASGKCREFISEFMHERGIVVDSQVSEFDDPYSDRLIPLVNLIAHIEPDEESGKSILLAAHYDSRPRADRAFDTSFTSLPIDGANDGASGVAVLLAIADLLYENQPPVSVDLLFLDGEDWGKEGDFDYYLLGSRSFAKTGIHGKYDFAIVVDMVGDLDQKIYREEYSQRFFKSINDMIWNSAKELGVTTFTDSVRSAIIDDHLPISAAGVPAVVIIDLDYPYWHTEMDSPDKCSAESLENVGKVLTRIVYKPSLWPEKTK